MRHNADSASNSTSTSVDVASISVDVAPMQRRFARADKMVWESPTSCHQALRGPADFGTPLAFSVVPPQRGEIR
eukprot:2011854-Pyramimonas_sp.AAC.1